MEREKGSHESPGHVVVHIPEQGNVTPPVSSTVSPFHGLDSTHGRSPTTEAPPQPCSSSAVPSNSAAHSSSSLSYYKIIVSIKLTYNAILIIASTIVLILSRHERPSNPLFSWIVGYIIGCAASVPVAFRHCFLPHPRLCRLIDQFKLALELFYASWFMVGNYWVFTEDASDEAPGLYNHCIALIVFSYIKYVGPFVLQAMVVCCCRGILSPIAGAPTETIDALPTYKFKLGSSSGELDGGAETHDGGVVGAGTERERNLSGDDAACCICLASYGDNDELKELPCSHLFHASCVDIWLKLKAFCPLCKCRVVRATGAPPSAPSSVE
ncbi:unnamed protein product [Linum tenue]|uniref:RING-type domain-containing protein n=1 Tax=Linum tenue TaxID=586396 RepID=A0AAV0HXD4_9ROSI|nr:unnamed protein product [Linum tenue]